MAKGASGGFSQQIDIRIAAAVIAVALVVFGGLYYLLTRPEKPIIIPPTAEETTVMVLNKSMERVVDALSANGRPPKTVADLPPPADGIAQTTDGWNNEIVMKFSGGGSRYHAEIRSKGPDGTAGNGDDIVVEGVIEKTPNNPRFYISAQSQKGGTPPTPPPDESGS